jgi:hypothetical protein
MREKWQVGNLQGAKQLNTPRQQLAYLYFEDEPQRQMSMKRMSRDEAFLIAVNIAKAAKRAAADIAGHSAAAEFSQPGRLSAVIAA